MSRFIIHICIICIIIYLFINPTATSLRIEEKGKELWSNVLQTYNKYMHAEKSAVKYITPRTHF